jgi:hypothetical protein
MDRSPRWQFSLLTLLALTAVVAVTSAAVTSPPNWISGMALGFLSFAFPTAFVLVIVYGEGYWRAFCIGALVPSLEGWIMSAFAVMFVAVESFATSATMVTTAAPPTTMMTPTYAAPAPAGSVPEGGTVPAAVPSSGFLAADDQSSAPVAIYENPGATPAPAPPSPASPNSVTVPPSPASPDSATAAVDESGDASAAMPNVGVSYSTVTGPMTTTNVRTYGVEYRAIQPMATTFAQLFRVGGAIYWTFAAILGFFAVGVRWLIEWTKARRVAAVKASV